MARKPSKPKSASVVPADYRKQHQPDQFAVRLRKRVTADDGTIDPATLKEFAEANDVWQARYASLNVGMQFMNVSNRLRALMRRSEKVKW